MTRGDWMPSSGEAVLRMARNWVIYIPKINDKLMVPVDAMTTLSQKTESYEALYRTPQAARTPVMNAQLRSTRKDLETVMRYIKRRHFFSPPLTGSDIVSLGMKIKDKVKTPVGDPIGLVTATVKYPNEGALELRIHHMSGTPFDKRANYGVKIRYGLFHIDHPEPDNIEMLMNNKFTKRKKELYTFEKHDRKKIAYFTMRYENSKGKAGQWCPIISAIIP